MAANTIITLARNVGGSATSLNKDKISGFKENAMNRARDAAKLSIIDTKLVKTGASPALISFLYVLLDNTQQLSFEMFKSNDAMISELKSATGYDVTLDDLKKTKLDIDTVKTYNETIIFDKRKHLSLILTNNNIQDVSVQVDMTKKNGMCENQILLDAIADSIGAPHIKVSLSDVNTIAKAMVKTVTSTAVDSNTSSQLLLQTSMEDKRQEVKGIIDGKI